MKHEESNEQRKVVDWCRANKIFIFAIPNGSVLKGNAMQRAKQMHSLTLDGLLNGASDLVCMLDKKILFIEMKKKRTKKANGEYKALSSDGISISEFQHQFMDTVNEFDYAVAKICFGANEAIEFIKKYRKI